jgi:hypothetical protein
VTRCAVLFVVGDDVGYSDFGYFNDYKTITPTVDNLLATGIHLADYCESSRLRMPALISRRRLNLALLCLVAGYICHELA